MMWQNDSNVASSACLWPRVSIRPISAAPLPPPKYNIDGSSSSRLTGSREANKQEQNRQNERTKERRKVGVGVEMFNGGGSGDAAAATTAANTSSSLDQSDMLQRLFHKFLDPSSATLSSSPSLSSLQQFLAKVPGYIQAWPNIIDPPMQPRGGKNGKSKPILPGHGCRENVQRCHLRSFRLPPLAHFAPADPVGRPGVGRARRDQLPPDPGDRPAAPPAQASPLLQTSHPRIRSHSQRCGKITRFLAAIFSEHFLAMHFRPPQFREIAVLQSCPDLQMLAKSATSCSAERLRKRSESSLSPTMPTSLSTTATTWSDSKSGSPTSWRPSPRASSDSSRTLWTTSGRHSAASRS